MEQCTKNRIVVCFLPMRGGLDVKRQSILVRRFMHPRSPVVAFLKSSSFAGNLWSKNFRAGIDKMEMLRLLNKLLVKNWFCVTL